MRSVRGCAVRFLLTAVKAPAGITPVAEPDAPFTVLPKEAMPFRAFAAAVLLSFFWHSASGEAASAKAKQLAQWKELTSSNAPAPKVFVKDRTVRLYFQEDGKTHLFTANRKHDRMPTDKYQVAGARIHSSRRVSALPEADPGWREARILSGQEAQRVGAELLKRLTPEESAHAFSYEALFADRALYRDAQGTPRVAFQKDIPKGIAIDHHYFLGESLEIISKELDEILAASYPQGSLFAVMVPNASHFVQPLVIDRKEHQCVCLCLAALFDSGENGVGLRVAADGFTALVVESHGLALLKNPLSSVARLADGVVQDSIRVVRIPGLSLSRQTIPGGSSGGMDLEKWEKWLDHHTGTRLEQGSLRILPDGDQFFGRFREAIAQATNHISANVYIFDRDDVAIEIANLLKQRSAELPVRVTYDRLCSLVGALLPKTTPMPEDFVPPAYISRYLRKNSKVQVRPFFNPWISVNHSKLFLVDGQRAWIGGMNLGREYMHEWHDLMIEIQGPVVASLERQFEREWEHAGPWGDIGYIGAVLREKRPTEHAATPDRWSKVRRLPTSKGLRKPFMTAALTSLDQARSYIYIENGYLFDHGVVASLIRARNRGVDVRVIMPRLNNFTVGIRSNLAIADRLRRNGIRVYLWPGMTHAKALLVDDWACLGSANLNQWSLRLSEEENIATSDPAFAAHLKSQVFEPDFARSYQLTEPIRLNLADHVVDRLLSY